MAAPQYCSSGAPDFWFKTTIFYKVVTLSISYLTLNNSRLHLAHTSNLCRQVPRACQIISTRENYLDMTVDLTYRQSFVKEAKLVGHIVYGVRLSRKIDPQSWHASSRRCYLSYQHHCGGAYVSAASIYHVIIILYLLFASLSPVTLQLNSSDSTEHDCLL